MSWSCLGSTASWYLCLRLISASALRVSDFVSVSPEKVSGAIPAGNNKEIQSVKPALIIHSNFSSEGRDPASSNSEDDIWIKHNETPVHRIHGQIQLDGGSTVSCNAATSSKGYFIYTKCKKKLKTYATYPQRFSCRTTCRTKPRGNWLTQGHLENDHQN